MFNIVLVNPQIPPNTGNIGRICVNTGATLHLIKPLGFSIDDKAIKRAGLDYWHKLNLKVWESLDEFLAVTPHECYHLATTKVEKPYFQAQFKPGDYLLFGSETQGLPLWLIDRFKSQAVTIPMTKEGRSLNLAVSVGIILYEGIRQNFGDFG
ncbi:tRNA (cytidine(34)-2'-O)-methyltransferase [Nitratiruptor sp. YY09-18]|uniref:tRNA (cytidine(34)-2'-O)-methyltransferase n=1 Tax=Nitratiruptor sp. YY09-18 TaxID=2724901 RepID=UPI0019161862|nr:tRNA (cytidine(34)-2'-O)-methyltransferase [Nitratiruptor sp. YY09-18]BCD67929.1 tRNA (cytidine/uridine-2'-O-)-methyltransferase [Nitratiruptor sp. YY09-18]